MGKLPVFKFGTKESSSLEVRSRLFSSAATSTTTSPTNKKPDTNVLATSQSTPALASINAQAATSLYCPLQGDEIRLIELKRGQLEQDGETASDNITLSLVTVRLSDAPEYTALSYVWGSEKDSAVIKIDGVDFHVTQNLNDAVLQLRNLMRDDQEQNKSPLLLWVDAVAINQSDIAERNEQVPRMRDIYASAKHVAIWLGKGDSNLEILLGLITEVPGIVPDTDPETWDSSNVFQWHETVNKWDPEAGTFCMVNSHGFIKLPYFSRVWVVQEVAFATDAYVMYGSKVAPYRKFYDFIHFISKLSAVITSIFSGTKAYLRMAKDPGSLFLGPEPGRALNGRFMTMGEWLIACSHRSCHDPRDKIYGFYGCFTEPIRDRIAIDYRKPVIQVCSEMTRAIIQVTGCLLIMDAVDEFRLSPGPATSMDKKNGEWLPTWSPDYSNPAGPSIWDTTQQHLQRVNPSPSYFRFSQHGRVLHARGVRLGTVRSTWCTNQIVIPRGFFPDNMPFDSTQLRITQCANFLGIRQDHLLQLLMDGGGAAPDDDLHRRLAVMTNKDTGAIWIRDACSANNCDYINKGWGGEGRTIFTMDTTTAVRVSDSEEGQQGGNTGFLTRPEGSAFHAVRTGDHVYVLEGGHRYMVLRELGDSGYHGVVCTARLAGQQLGIIWAASRFRGCEVEEIVLL